MGDNFHVRYGGRNIRSRAVRLRYDVRILATTILDVRGNSIPIHIDHLQFLVHRIRSNRSGSVETQYALTLGNFLKTSASVKS